MAYFSLYPLVKNVDFLACGQVDSAFIVLLQAERRTAAVIDFSCVYQSLDMLAPFKEAKKYVYQCMSEPHQATPDFLNTAKDLSINLYAPLINSWAW